MRKNSIDTTDITTQDGEDARLMLGASRASGLASSTIAAIPLVPTPAVAVELAMTTGQVAPTDVVAAYRGTPNAYTGGGITQSSAPGLSTTLASHFSSGDSHWHYTPDNNQDIDALLYGTKWTGTHLTISFPTSSSVYDYSNSDVVSHQMAFNAAQQHAAEYALMYVACYTNLSFSEITETSTTHANLRYSQTNSTDPNYGGAFSYYPSDYSSGGDVWLGTAGNQPYYLTPAIGNWGMATIMHETGHALGLKHGHEDLTATGGTAALPSAHDGQAWSLMTYQSDPGNSPTVFEGDQYNQPQTYMQDDIAALQYLYGANFTTWSGDTKYSFDPTTGEMTITVGSTKVPQGVPQGNIIFRTIWDGGGYDRYMLQNYTTNMSIDLRPGAWSIFDTTNHAQLANTRTVSNGPVYAPGNIANALLYNGDTRSLIEDAYTGSGNDHLIGNDGNNGLGGGLGSDILEGGDGDDSLFGNYTDPNRRWGDDPSENTMYGGRGNDNYSLGNANDHVIENAGEGIDTVFSPFSYTLGNNVENLFLEDSGNISGSGNGLDNLLGGNSGNNLLYGNGGNDTLDGRAGADGMTGGTGNDIYFVDTVGDYTVENAGEGIDTVEASLNWTLASNVENLILLSGAAVSGTGNSLDNIITGNANANTLNGGDGNDTLDGGLGADTLTGGLGNDTYVVDNTGDIVVEAASAGTDTVQSSMTYMLGSNFEALILTGTLAINGTGNSLDNAITGNSGDKILDGGVGADTLAGGQGNDTYIIDSNSDIVV